MPDHVRTTPSHVDSTGKLLNRLALLTGDEVTQRGKRLVDPPRKDLLLMPSLARDFTCVAGCTACCLPFTLDFTPWEWRNYTWPTIGKTDAPNPRDLFEDRTIEVNGREFTIKSYPQYKDDQCPFLQPVREGGHLGCTFWPKQPLECAAAPQLLMTTRGDEHAALMKKPFGRAWAWKETPQCEFTQSPLAEKDLPARIDLSNEVSLLKRYQRWASYLEIDTVISEVLSVLKDFRRHLIDNEMRSISIPLT